MKSKIILFTIILILILGTLAGYFLLHQPRISNVNDISYCVEDGDCEIVNLDCTGCSCKFEGVNKEYLAIHLEECANQGVHEVCDLYCPRPTYMVECVDNKCQEKDK
jgi:hypothetical protein